MVRLDLDLRLLKIKEEEEEEQEDHYYLALVNVEELEESIDLNQKERKGVIEGR